MSDALQESIGILRALQAKLAGEQDVQSLVRVAQLKAELQRIERGLPIRPASILRAVGKKD